LHGRVKKILPHGRAGFIAGEKGTEYYFTVKSFKGAQHRLKEGLEVDFYIEKSFDPKKQKESEVAVNIREIMSGSPCDKDISKGIGFQ
jgi:hypothetical protein